LHDHSVATATGKGHWAWEDPNIYWDPILGWSDSKNSTNV